jgi:hypothetical protein
MDRERSEAVTGTIVSIQRPIFRHATVARGVRKWTTTGHADWKLPIRVFLLGLSPGFFEKRLGNNTEAFQATKRVENRWDDASQGKASLPNAP